MKEHIKIVDAMIESLKFSAVDRKPIIPTLKVAKEAMQRRTPTKPDLWGDGVGDDGELLYDMYNCPNCNTSYELDYQKHKCCPECGQVFDWSVE